MSDPDLAKLREDTRALLDASREILSGAAPFASMAGELRRAVERLEKQMISLMNRMDSRDEAQRKEAERIRLELSGITSLDQAQSAQLDELRRAVFGEANSGGLQRRAERNEETLARMEAAQADARAGWRNNLPAWAAIVITVLGGGLGLATWAIKASMSQATQELRREVDIINYRLDNSKPSQGIAPPPKVK